MFVAAHGNSIRAIVKMIEGISDDVIPGLEIPTGALMEASLGLTGAAWYCRSMGSFVTRVGLVHFVVSWWALKVCDGCWMTILPVQ